MATVRQYRKKPVVIDAMHVTANTPLDQILAFVGQENIEIVGLRPGIKTLEGTMVIGENDYVIKGVQGEFYPCKPDIFKATYEEVK